VGGKVEDLDGDAAGAALAQARAHFDMRALGLSGIGGGSGRKLAGEPLHLMVIVHHRAAAGIPTPALPA
jgi:hypothetical protein